MAGLVFKDFLNYAFWQSSLTQKEKINVTSVFNRKRQFFALLISISNYFKQSKH